MHLDMDKPEQGRSSLILSKTKATLSEERVD